MKKLGLRDLQCFAPAVHRRCGSIHRSNERPAVSMCRQRQHFCTSLHCYLLLPEACICLPDVLNPGSSGFWSLTKREGVVGHNSHLCSQPCLGHPLACSIRKSLVVLNADLRAPIVNVSQARSVKIAVPTSIIHASCERRALPMQHDMFALKSAGEVRVLDVSHHKNRRYNRHIILIGFNTRKVQA